MSVFTSIWLLNDVLLRMILNVRLCLERSLDLDLN